MSGRGRSFTFHHDCRDNGVIISVDSKFPYSGALYALYDFFTCRIEPKDETNFSLFFPFPSYSKNCSDSFSQKESNNVLDVVLSTDGMEPLYFLTDQDTLYQAKCPSSMTSSKPPKATILGKFSDKVESSTPFLESESFTHISSSAISEQRAISSTSDLANVTTFSTPSSSTVAESSDYIVSFTESFSTGSSSPPEVSATPTDSIAHSTSSSSSLAAGHAFFTPTTESSAVRHVHWTFAPDVELLLNNSSPAVSSTSNVIAAQILDVSPVVDKNNLLQESTVNQSKQTLETYTIALNHFTFEKSTPFSRSSMMVDSVESTTPRTTIPLFMASSTERPEDSPASSTRKFETFVFNHMSSTSKAPSEEKLVTRKVVVLEPSMTSRTPEQEKEHGVTTPELVHLVAIGQKSAATKNDENVTRKVSTSAPLIDRNSKQQNNESVTTNLTEKVENQEQQPKEKISFEIFHNNQPVNAVVVASRIVLNFNSTAQLPSRSYLNVLNCQVEPVNSPYASERDPIQIVKNGCQADGVGLVCPPIRADGGEKIEMEALRYTHTSEVLFTCIVRTCGYGQCIEPVCKSVDGCFTLPTNPSLLFQQNLLNNNINFFNNRAFRRRNKRQAGFFPFSGQQQQSAPLFPLVPGFQVPGALQHNLQQQINSGAFVADRDAVVTRKLIVVNTENELQYFLRTGNVPPRNFNFNGFIYRR
uniref:ZP domain-containing protein n=1 Tax=Romanomermis culicivorax TaxID=13658 RepID=A0A915L824_ROMCU